MPSGPPPSGPRWEGSAAPDSAQQEALEAFRALAAGRYEILGLLGRDREGSFACLARDPADRLAVLKRPPGTGSLQIIDRLDDSVPPPAGSCPVCQTPFADWSPTCTACGADVAGSGDEPLDEVARAQQLAAVREAAQGYEVVGTMRRAQGGATVYFARELSGGNLVALRLDREEAPGRRSGYTVAATRMMRPKQIYGTVGGGWGPSPVRSPSVPFRATGVGRDPSGVGTAGGAMGGERICPQCGEVFGPELRFCPRDGSVLRARAATEELVGDVIAERYHVIQKLGEGGMGRVYLAEHVRMGRRCAVKVMHPGLLHDPDSVSRFNREAANASRINHPNVAAIYDFGETAEGVVYLAMELIEGESLASVLARERTLSESRAIAIARQASEALAAAHDLGIVHRDLKPDNIMLARSREGRDLVKVVDFGIAKATRGGRQDVTRTGYVVGTPAYMSPEQILGESLDGRSDIYSLGCILYEALTGERPFTGPSGEIAIRLRLTESAPRARDIRRSLSRELDRVVATAMARSPEQRFQSASAVGEALEAAGREVHSQGRWRSWLPWRRHTPLAGDTSTSPRSVEPAGTVPVPVGWSQVGLPVSRPAGQETVRFHRHPAQAEGRKVGRFAGIGGALMLLLLLGYWLIPSGDDRQEAPAPPISVPATPPPPEPSGRVPEPLAPITATMGGLRLESPLPAGTRLTLDGENVEWAAGQVIALSPGRHTIAARAPGHEPSSQSVEVIAGDTAGLSFALVRREAPRPVPRPTEQAPPAPAPERPAEERPAPERPPPEPAPGAAQGTIRVSGTLPAGAQLAIDGKPMPAGQQEAQVEAGEHWVRLAAAGFQRESVLIQVEAGATRAWVPRLVPITRPPQPKPKEAPPPAETPAPEEPAEPAVDHAGQIRQLLSDYERAVNERNLARIKALYPGLSPDRERQWRDLFRDEVESLKATVAVGSIRGVPAAPEVSFRLVLSFKPEGAKQQTFRILNQATVSSEPGPRRFLSISERGE